MLIANQVDLKFSNKIAQLDNLLDRHTAVVEEIVLFTLKRPGICNPDVRMAFTSSSTVVTTQFISFSILTTISIILSTAATLSGSQDKIKAGIALVKEKLDAYKKAK
jgi:hypothetical protein